MFYWKMQPQICRRGIYTLRVFKDSGCQETGVRKATAVYLLRSDMKRLWGTLWELQSVLWSEIILKHNANSIQRGRKSESFLLTCSCMTSDFIVPGFQHKSTAYLGAKQQRHPLFFYLFLLLIRCEWKSMAGHRTDWWKMLNFGTLIRPSPLIIQTIFMLVTHTL